MLSAYVRLGAHCSTKPLAAAFPACYFVLRVVPASKQPLAEHVMQHFAAKRKSFNQKTRLPE